MSLAVRFGPPPVPLEPIVAETVDALGYVRSECAEELAALLSSLWLGGVSGTMLMSRDARPAFEPMLSDRGRADPYHAAKVVALRVISTVQRARFDRDEAHWSSVCSRVRFAARAEPKLHCQRALDLDGLVAPREERFSLPLPDCDREWCPCRWDQLPDE